MRPLSGRRRPGGAAAAGLLSTKRILFIGDSTMAGRGAGTGAAFMNGARVLSMPYRAAEGLKLLGFPAFAQDSIGDANNGVLTNLPLYDTRVSYAATPATASEGPSLGGVVLRLAGNISFVPTADITKVELYHNSLAGYGTIRLSVDGVAATPDINEANNPGHFLRETFTVTKGQPTLTLSTVSGTTRRTAMVCYDSTTAPCFITMNSGTREWATADFIVATNEGSPFNAASAYVGAGDLIIANIGINDCRLSVAQATYEANLNSLVDQWQATGATVILMIPTPVASDGAAMTEAQMRTSIATVSTAQGLATPINCPAATGTWATMLANGETVDSFHITAAPYQRVVDQLLIPAIRTWAGV
jgi:hypothetical protein